MAVAGAHVLAEALRDLGLRVSLWPVASSAIRRRMAAESLFRS